MEENVREILYETRHHASRPYSSNYPPLQQLNEGAKARFLSLLSAPGLSHLKEKWREHRHPQRLRKLVSLFVSPKGERVAIAAGNEITILHMDDDYKEPCGYFACSSFVTFTCGAWLEAHDILGVTDDTDTLYFIRVNGEEISRLTKRQLKVSSPIIDLIVFDDTDGQKSCLCAFSVLTSDGNLHDIDISKDPRDLISSMCTSINGSLLKKQFPPNVFCVDYHPETSLLAVVSTGASISLTSGNTGSYNLCIWRRTGKLNLESVLSTQFEGLYSKPKGYVDPLASPKVLFSPGGKLVATLDIRGSLVMFKLNDDQRSLSNISTVGKEWLGDTVDFTWWAENILTLAKRSGIVAMFDVLNGVTLSETNPIYSMPVLERVQKFPGHLFLLESSATKEEEQRNLGLMELITVDKYNQLDIAKLQWSLMSFSERSVPEMYDILISGRKYQEALEFADRHGLDKDEVLKSQWLDSGQGIKEITTLLSNIKDRVFVLSECVDRAGQTEDATRALLAYGLRLTNQYMFSESEDDTGNQMWEFRLARLKLLQFQDKLETFLGINLSRFSMQEYQKFRSLPIKEAALVLAESGKIGALNLLFKRHPYSLTPFMLEVLAAIPETIPVQTYGQLLPGFSPPSSITLREEDWVECEKMVTFVCRLPKDHESSVHIKTEPIVKQIFGLLWPSVNELTTWYKNRARVIDTLSGQLDNSLSLVDAACRKGVSDLQRFHKDISYLHQLIYSDISDEDETNFTMSLVVWEQLSDYDKFKMMLKGVKEENVVERLQNKAIPYVQNMDNCFVFDRTAGSFLVRWLKERSLENKLELCLVVIEEGCRLIRSNGFFENEAEAVDCALQCIYLCTNTDMWNTMASILSKLPALQDPEVEDLKRRLKVAEGHIEAGRILTFYQVPKPISFLVEPQSDVKGVKQIIRLILSKFIRRLPSRSDNDWANMWRDLQSLQEKAFPFLDLEYILMEFCRGLLKAGKFSLARNYLKGTGYVGLATDKAENLVIQAAREYFFSASSLDCSEIWKAKECLNIFPSSRNVRAEVDTINALTVKLPNLGVNLLPVQFRQIKDPMEIIKLAITSQGGAYLNVDELVEIAKLLGLSSQDDISAVQEAIAREAAVAGDLQLAFDLCLVLAKKGHGSVWDLCAALARGPALENMDVNSRKQLLGFALSHCDEESIGELLHAWKDLDMQGQCEKLMIMTGTDPPNFSVQGASVISYPFHSSQYVVDLRDWSGQVNDQEVHFDTIKNVLLVAKNLPADNNFSDWESLLQDNGKIFSFAALRLPWLLKLSQFTETDKKLSVRTQAIVTILSWLARNDFAPKDDLIASLAKSILTPPVIDVEDVLGCSFLLNLMDAFHGVEVIEEQVRSREEYNEISSIMNVGMIYSSLHNSGFECEGPIQRRELLLRKFKEKHTALSSDEWSKLDKAQSSFWREWKLKLEDQKRVADHTRVLDQIIPGVETARFLSGDIDYMESVVFALAESVKLEKKQILNDVLKLASNYGLDQTKVLQHYLGCVLVSEVWTTDDLTAEISEHRGKILACATESIKTISSSVYPAINGHNKRRLAYIYSLLSDCYLQLEQAQELLPVTNPDTPHVTTPRLSHFYKMIEQECSRISFIKGLDFKNIAGLRGLNLECFSREVYAHIDEYTVEALAKMVQTLVDIYGDPVPEGLLSWQDVYRHHVLSLLSNLETRAKTGSPFQNPENLHDLLNELEHTYDKGRKYIIALPYPDVLGIMKLFFTIILPFNNSLGSLSCDSAWQDCLIVLLNFWLRLTNEMQELPRCLKTCLKAFISLAMGEKVSPSQGWRTVIDFVDHGLDGDVAVEIFQFCRAMIFSGCRFEAVADLFSNVVSEFPPGSTLITGGKNSCDSIQDLPHLYLSILETILWDLAVGESAEHANLHNLLSSLSKIKDNSEEDLNRVRHVVWTRMAKFSDNLELPSHVRLYILELMQFISAGGRNLKAFFGELQANVVPWEGWDPSQNSAAENETSNHGSTLIALKSSQLVSEISSSIQITPEDLSTAESAVSCFLNVCGAANSEIHFETLLAIVEEWEGLFITSSSGRDDDDVKELSEASDGRNDWGSEGWDEGWESFQEEPPVLDNKELKKEENNITLAVHPLHACWLEILKKLVQFSRFRDLLKLMDKSMEKTHGVLLDENGARFFSQTVLEVDCFVALKTALLLPYDGIQLECLDAVEDKLKHIDISDTMGRDHEFLIVALYSGIMSSIITKPCYGTTFSYLCYVVGNFSCRCQEAYLSNLKQRGTENNEKDILFIFIKILFPCFIAELVKADQKILAGILVTKFMHTNTSLSLINVAEASLRRFLETQLQVLEDNAFTSEVITDFPETLVNTVVCLRGRLGKVVQTALSLI